MTSGPETSSATVSTGRALESEGGIRVRAVVIVMEEPLDRVFRHMQTVDRGYANAPGGVIWTPQSTPSSKKSSSELLVQIGDEWVRLQTHLRPQ